MHYADITYVIRMHAIYVQVVTMGRYHHHLLVAMIMMLDNMLPTIPIVPMLPLAVGDVTVS